MLGNLKIFSGSAHPALTAAICRHVGIPLGRSHTHRFSNENLKVKIDENVREGDVFVVQTSCTPVSDGILELLIMIDALRSASAGRITAVMPYFPYARSDKKDEPRISITARLIADLLETAGADRVLTMDLHSPQVQGFFRIPTDQLSAVPLTFDADAVGELWQADDLEDRRGNGSRPALQLRQLELGYRGEVVQGSLGRLRYASSTLGMLDGGVSADAMAAADRMIAAE